MAEGWAEVPIWGTDSYLRKYEESWYDYAN
jgi:hypothetical protein